MYVFRMQHGVRHDFLDLKDLIVRSHADAIDPLVDLAAESAPHHHEAELFEPRSVDEFLRDRHAIGVANENERAPRRQAMSQGLLDPLDLDRSGYEARGGRERGTVDRDRDP